MERRPRYLDTVFSILIIIYIFFQLNIWPDSVPVLVRSLVKELILPGFFMAEGSALCLEKAYQQKEIVYFKDCCKRYLLLYLIFSGIGLLIRLISYLTGIGTVSGLQLQLQFFDTLNFSGYGLLWIVPVMFIVMVIYGLLRSYLPYGICLFITLLLFILSYFSNDIWTITNQTDITMKQYFLKLSMSLWRACGFMVFTSLGEGLELILQEKKSHKVLLGIIGIILVAAGFFMTYFNKDIVTLKEMQYGEIYLTIFEILLIGTGVSLFARWIGQLGALELLGRNWYILFLCSDSFFLLSAVNIIGKDIFQIFNNNFLTALTRLICYLIVLITLMLLWETHLKKYWINPVIEKNDKIETKGIQICNEIESIGK